MKLLTGVAVLFVLVALFLGCASDLVLKDDPPLDGEYRGVYKVIRNQNHPTNETIDSAFIMWTFTERGYIMKFDPDAYSGDETPVCFCRVDGNYALTDGVRLKQLHSQPDGSVGCTACNEADNPEGTFRRETGGGATILKLLEGTIYKEIRLFPYTPPADSTSL